MVGRAVYGWIADECSRSTVKNSLAVLVRVVEQAVRDGILDVNPARVVGWQHEYKQAEDELDDPRSLALQDWDALNRLASALVARSAGEFEGWGDVVRFETCTATRIGEVSGVQVRDINRDAWTWEVCRQTTPGPGGLTDKGTKGKRRRTVPIVHLPSHGGQAIVQYTGHSGGDGGGDAHSCSINQAGGNGSDTWKELGSLSLSKGAYITANNLSSSGTGDADVAFDAIALVPVSSGVAGACGWDH